MSTGFLQSDATPRKLRYGKKQIILYHHISRVYIDITNCFPTFTLNSKLLTQPAFFSLRRLPLHGGTHVINFGGIFFLTHCHLLLTVRWPHLTCTFRPKVLTLNRLAKTRAQFHRAAKHKNLLSMKFLP